MPLPTYSELYLGMAKIIRDVDPNIPLILKGMPHPELADYPDFLAFDLLNETEKPTRNQDGDKMFNIQLACNSAHAEYRADRKITAPYDIATIYKPYIHRANHMIKNTCFRTLDAKITYLDLRSAGDYSKQIYQNSPSLKIHTCIIHAIALIS